MAKQEKRSSTRAKAPVEPMDLQAKELAGAEADLVRGGDKNKVTHNEFSITKLVD